MDDTKQREKPPGTRERHGERVCDHLICMWVITLLLFFCRYKNWVLKFQSKGCSASSAHMLKESPQDTQCSLLEATSELKLILTNSITWSQISPLILIIDWLLTVRKHSARAPRKIIDTEREREGERELVLQETVRTQKWISSLAWH